MTRKPPEKLVRVGTYDWPRPPPTSSLRARFRQLRDKVEFSTPDPSKEAPDSLETLPDPLFPDSIWDELRARYHALLDTQFLTSPARPRGINALVTMPSLPDGFVQDWAAAHDLPINLPEASIDDSADFSLVPMTRMAHRTLAARAASRRHLASLDQATRQSDRGGVLLCGSSWAWTYLARTASLQAVVSNAYCFPAYDGAALAALIKDHIGTLKLKSVESGNDILKCDDDGHPKDNFLAALAAASYGCPWAALRLLEKEATQQESPDDEKDGNSDDSQPKNMRWICDPTPPSPPDHLGRAGHFLLHALLIHGPMPEDDIAQVLPLPLPIGLPSALARAGLVEMGHGEIQIATQSYPHIRHMLTEAGFPADQL